MIYNNLSILHDNVNDHLGSMWEERGTKCTFQSIDGFSASNLQATQRSSLNFQWKAFLFIWTLLQLVEPLKWEAKKMTQKLQLQIPRVGNMCEPRCQIVHINVTWACCLRILCLQRCIWVFLMVVSFIMKWLGSKFVWRDNWKDIQWVWATMRLTQKNRREKSL